jgi:hypothetical protein
VTGGSVNPTRSKVKRVADARTVRAVPMIGATAMSTASTSSVVMPASVAISMLATYETGGAPAAASAESRAIVSSRGDSSHSFSDDQVIDARTSSSGRWFDIGPPSERRRGSLCSAP